MSESARFGPSVMELLGEDAPPMPTNMQRLLIGLRLWQAGITEVANAIEAMMEAEQKATRQ